MNRRLTCVLTVILAFTGFALSLFTPGTTVYAVTPAPDAGYPGYNTAEGDNPLAHLTTGEDNTAIGDHALYYDTTGEGNVGVGASALLYNVDGSANVAIGRDALNNLQSGLFNTAIGAQSLEDSYRSNYNTAIGAATLQVNSGDNNTAIGLFALTRNDAGSNNTAIGVNALWGNTTGHDNAANGYQALNYNTTASFNTADGQCSSFSNTTGHNNTAAGQNALRNNTTGSNNVALGSNAGKNLTNGDNNIDIFDRGVAGEANAIRVGTQGTQKATFIAGIRGTPVSGQTVVVDANGQLGTQASSERFKESVKPMDSASEAILALKPVTFRYKEEIDPGAVPQFGLIAEQVEKVDPELVARDDRGKPYTVRYDAVNAMLLNEFLKEHRKGEQQDRKIEELEATVAKLESALKAEASKIQEVSDQLAVTQSSAAIACR